MRVGNFTLMRDGSRKGWDAIHAAVQNNVEGLWMSKSDYTRVAYPRARRAKIGYLPSVLAFIEAHRQVGDLDSAEILSRFWPELRRVIGVFVIEQLRAKFLDSIPNSEDDDDTDMGPADTHF